MNTRIIIKKEKVNVMMKLLCAAFFTLHSSLFTSCSDWDDHYVEPENQASDGLTMFQELQKHTELTDFSEVLSKTKLLKQHHKTAVSYADQLNGSQSFTVFAPVNGTFDKESLIKQLSTDSGDSTVIRSFVGNHLSYGITSSTSKASELFLLNTKRATIEGGKVLGTPIVAGGENISVKGGILHILERPLPYRHNLYEALLNDERYAALGQLINSYDEDEFSPSKSIAGDMVDGEQLYVDSVFDEKNVLLDRVGQIAVEDSSFIMVVPTATEWDRVWQEALTYYRFNPTLDGADSLQRLSAARALLSDAIFSNRIQSSPSDSLKTYDYDRKYPQYHVFHKPFEEGGILHGAVATECSNGTLYTAEKWPFTPQTTYQREIKIEGEKAEVMSYKLCTYHNRQHLADSVSENSYLDILYDQSTKDWNITFKLQDILSGTYDVCVILLPLTVYDPSVQLKSTKFTAEINYIDAKGKAVTYKCLNKDGKKDFLNDPARVDTLVLAEDFEFPVCNYDQNNEKSRISLTLKTAINPSESKKYSREVFLDCIYLRPKESKK